MSIQVDEFIRRVNAGQSVRGEHIEGEVFFSNCELIETDWSGCRFDAAVRVTDCFAKRTLSLKGSTVKGDLLIYGLAFRPEQAQTVGLNLRGLVCGGNVWLEEVAHSNVVIEKMSLTTHDSLDEFVHGSGMDLSGMQVAQSLLVAGCTRMADETSILSLDYTRVGTFAEIGSKTTFQHLLASNFHVHGNCVMSVAVDPVADAVKRASGEEGEKIIILSSMVCDGNLSIGLENKKVTELNLSGARIGGHLKIRSNPEHNVKVEYLELKLVCVGRYALIRDFGLAQGTLDGMRCDSSLSIKKLRGFAFEDSRGQVLPPKLSLIHVAISGNLALSQLDSFAFVDASHAKAAGDLILSESKGLGEITLNDCQANLIDVNKCVAMFLNGIDLRTGGMQLDQLRIAGAIDLMRSRFQGGVIITCVVAEKLDLTAALVGVRLRIDPDREVLVNELRREKLNKLAEMLSNEPCTKGAAALPHGKRIDVFHELENRPGYPLITVLKHICLDDSELPLADLSGAFMIKKSTKGNPAISARRIRAKSQLKVRADQFVSEYELPLPRQGNDTPAVLDLTQAEIGELDMGEPLPASISLRGATIENWGLKDCDTSPGIVDEMTIAKRYDEILSRADALELRQYIRIETELENAGQRNDADELHRLWRTRARKQLPRGVRRSVSWLHSIALGYGTQRFRLVCAMAAVGGIALSAGYVWYYESFQVSSSVLSTLTQCGAPCAQQPLPVLASTWSGKLWDCTQLVLRHGIPLIDLQLAGHLEPKPGSGAANVVSLVRAIGWITWPVLLTSLISSFFPKRHQA